MAAGDVQFNQLEYCYLVEDTAPDAKTMKVYIPKLMSGVSQSNQSTPAKNDKGIFMNENKGDLNVSSSTGSQGYFEVPVVDPYEHKHKHHDCPGNCPNASHGNTCCGSSTLVPCPHFHHDHHFPHMDDYGKIPAGAKMICLIMDNNIKDIRITRLICEF